MLIYLVKNSSHLCVRACLCVCGVTVGSIFQTGMFLQSKTFRAAACTSCFPHTHTYTHTCYTNSYKTQCSLHKLYTAEKCFSLSPFMLFCLSLPHLSSHFAPFKMRIPLRDTFVCASSIKLQLALIEIEETEMGTFNWQRINCDTREHEITTCVTCD